eukprot:RCo029805
MGCVCTMEVPRQGEGGQGNASAPSPASSPEVSSSQQQQDASPIEGAQASSIETTLQRAPSGPGSRARKRAPEDARQLKYVDVATALSFSEAKAYAKDSEIGTPEEEFAKMSEEWKGSPELRQHWEYAVSPVPHSAEARKWKDDVRDNGHEGWALEDFLRCPQAQAAGLLGVHVAALRLYTGPGYTAINADLREMAGAFKVTVRLCMSAITMLSKAAAFQCQGGEPPKLFFRGLSGAIEQRFVDSYRALQSPPSEDGRRGFLVGQALCDLALMSTTTSAEVAAESFGGNIIFVISPLPLHYSEDMDGFEDSLRCGADVGWLSQYPQEAEWMFPCGTVLYPVPRSERLATLPFTPPPGKLVIQLFAYAPELQPHPRAGHAFYLHEEEKEAAEVFTAVRIFLKHNLSATIAGGLGCVVENTAKKVAPLDEAFMRAVFPSFAIPVPLEGAQEVAFPGSVTASLERAVECYADALIAAGNTPEEHFKACGHLYLEQWRALPQDVGLSYEAFRDVWVSMHQSILAAHPASNSPS